MKRRGERRSRRKEGPRDCRLRSIWRSVGFIVRALRPRLYAGGENLRLVRRGLASIRSDGVPLLGMTRRVTKRKKNWQWGFTISASARGSDRGEAVRMGLIAE